MACTTCNQQSEKLTEISEFIKENLDPVDPQGTLIIALHKAQELFGYLPKEAMEHVAKELQVPESIVYGVATFYSYFTLTPRGEYSVSVCMGTACYVKGAPAILDTVKQQLGIAPGETTDDGLFTLLETRCIGACGLAPIINIGEDVYGRLTPDQVPEIIEKYRHKKA